MTEPEQESDLDVFLEAYRGCILWTATDDNDEALDKRFGISDFSEYAMASTYTECRDFFEAARELIPPGAEGQAGHDFWLTRNGHGTGFWDRPGAYGSKRSCEELTRMAKACGERTAYVHEGKVEIE